MAKGDIKKLKFESFYDSESNNEVIRLTPTDILCHRNYFYQKCFTNDGKKLIFAAEFDCNRNYYLMDLVTQTAKQLTEELEITPLVASCPLMIIIFFM